MIPTKQLIAMALFLFTISIAPATAMPDGQEREVALQLAAITPGVAPGVVPAPGPHTTVGNTTTNLPSLQSVPGVLKPAAPTVSTSDATTIQGVNTAGTVRVNNLANLEAMLNIVANTAGIVFGALGLFYLSKIFRNGPHNSNKVVWLVIKGTTLISIGLMTPGVITWLVASARDSSSCGGIF